MAHVKQIVVKHGVDLMKIHGAKIFLLIKRHLVKNEAKDI
jgi:hypothetical protein